MKKSVIDDNIMFLVVSILGFYLTKFAFSYNDFAGITLGTAFSVFFWIKLGSIGSFKDIEVQSFKKDNN